MKMGKGKLLATAVLLGALFCAGCGTGKVQVIEKIEGEPFLEASPELIGEIALKEDLQDKDIQMPDYLRDDEEADQTVSGEKEGFHLSGTEQMERARQVAEHIRESVHQVLADKDYYPNIVNISVNPECTEFNVVFSSREISLYENVLPMSLCIVGNKFQFYQGKNEEELKTVVRYIDGKTGEIFATTNSNEIEIGK